MFCSDDEDIPANLRTIEEEDKDYCDMLADDESSSYIDSPDDDDEEDL